MTATTHESHGTGHDDHGHEHDHPAWLAHHFDDAEQQFDSGKLGMWLFLVTEVLFFSGMFCAYALLRSLNPEVFSYCSAFLNEKLGAINTGVLLFSSLTMAWAVRAAQLSQHRLLVALLGATLGCAAMFLGVKTVEYSHKWDLGLLPGMLYQAQVSHPEHHAIPTALPYLQAPGVVLLVGFALYWLWALMKRNDFHLQIAGPLAVAAACYVGGAFLGLKLEESAEHAETAAHATHDHSDHADHASEGTAVAGATDATALPVGSERENLLIPQQSHADQVAVEKGIEEVESPSVNQRGRAGVFFSIYYCMTGIHAIHILAGMGVIAWLIVKAARREFHSKYFGPVDNVGLYWHLVDFIWIYLFPLLYLIK
ncbi:MAG: cytochrome c oxidase subunit 3 [Pirellulaceae bacterium]|jgi:cytochrome c oxidase subunit 3